MSDRQDARGRRFTVAITKKRRLTQEQLDLFKNSSARTKEPAETASASDGKIIPDPPDA
jgi:hypothetical protein